MARFEVEANGKRYEVEAPSVQAAMAALGGSQGGAAQPPAGLKPGTREYADWAREQAIAGATLPQVSRDPNAPEARYDDALERVRRTQFSDMTDAQWADYSGSVLAPVNVTQQGGMATTLGFGDEIAGIVAGLGGATRQALGSEGDSFQRSFDDVQALEEARYNLGAQQNGALGQAVEVAGSLATLGPARNAAGTLASQVVGPLTQAGMRAANPGLVRTAVSSGAIGGLMGAAEGFGRASGPIEDRIEGAKAGGIAGSTIGTAVPIGTAGLGLTGRLAYNAAAPTVRAAMDAPAEALRRLGVAFGRDDAAGNVMTRVDEAAARAGGVPLSNVDRGGETVRALTRSVANQNPEARQTLTNLAQDRFRTQADRAANFVRRVMGGATDDIALQGRLEEGARLSNRPAYDAAYNEPNARAIWNPKIRQLMQSDIFRGALNAAETAGTDAAALSGNRAVRNPFKFGEDGSIALKMRSDRAREAMTAAQKRVDTAANTGNVREYRESVDALNKARTAFEAALRNDGPAALPTLEFWDIVQRNLRRVQKTAQRSGDDALSSTADQLRKSLNAQLDTAVPKFGKARKGAFEFFQAEDALEAGRNAVRSTGSVPEAKAAHAKMTPADKEAAAVGYASSLIDEVNRAQDRGNVIESLFSSPARRELNEIFLGKARAQQIEAYVRVEFLADRLRGALGNSTTARQLVELGIGGGAGFALSGDWMGALSGAALTRGGRYVGEKVDARVMEELAKLLTSRDPKAIERAIYQASLSPKWMGAVRQLSDNVSQYGGVLAANATVN